jgi:polyferredoxin
LLAALVILFALLSFFFPAKFRKLRWVLLVSEIAVLGVLSGSFLSLAFFNYTLINGIDMLMRWVIVSMAIVSILLPMFTHKSFYCQYLCPYGACQELLGKIPIKKVKLNTKTSQMLRKFRHFYLMIIAALLIAGIPIVLENFEPFMAFKIKFASWYSIAIAGVFLVLSLFFKKPWCNYFCPTGLFLELFCKPIQLNKKRKNGV